MPYFMNSPHKSILAALYDCFPAANAVLVFLLDHPLAWFTPKWRRKGRMALKAVRRYINYNRDLLPPERLAEFEESRDLLKTALYRGDRQQAETITAKLESTLESIPGAVPSALAENVEVLFVILAIFLGLRCYVVQPFRIPTGSMQPSLNGIRALPQEGDPTLMQKIGDMILYGGSYVHETASKEKKIVRFEPATKYLLLTVTNVISMTAPSWKFRQRKRKRAATSSIRNRALKPNGTPRSEATCPETQSSMPVLTPGT